MPKEKEIHCSAFEWWGIVNIQFFSHNTLYLTNSRVCLLLCQKNKFTNINRVDLWLLRISIVFMTVAKTKIMKGIGWLLKINFYPLFSLLQKKNGLCANKQKQTLFGHLSIQRHVIVFCSMLIEIVAILIL